MTFIYSERPRVWALIALVSALVLTGCLTAPEGEPLDCDETEEVFRSDQGDYSCGVRAAEQEPLTLEDDLPIDVAATTDTNTGSCPVEDCGRIED